MMRCVQHPNGQPSLVYPGQVEHLYFQGQPPRELEAVIKSPPRSAGGAKENCAWPEAFVCAVTSPS